jgi:Uma2 family endonuclease
MPISSQMPPGYIGIASPEHPIIAPTNTVVAAGVAAARITIEPGDGHGEFSIPPEAYTLGGFREWARSTEYPQRGQFTFSPTELIVDMSPQLFETHNFIKADIGLVVHALIRRQNLGRYFADRVMYSNDAVGFATEPDAMFISGATLQSGRCIFVESKTRGANIEVTGSPDWILEVVSPTSIRKDKVFLRDAYFRAGVREYWIIDALKNGITFEILVADRDGFALVADDNGWISSTVFGVAFRLTSETDSHGFLQYTLHVRNNP